MTRRILLLGATGRTGEAALNQALSRRWQVNALVRRPEALQERAGLTVMAGTPLDPEAVSKAIIGCDAVISVLNNNRTSDSIFARPVSPPSFMTDAIRNTLAAMQLHGVRRIAILSAAGVGDSFKEAPSWFRMMIRHTNLGHTYRDHDSLDALVRASDRDWTLARAVMLGSKPGAREVVASYAGNPRPGMQISRDSVGKFLLDSLDDPGLIGKAPTISES